MVTIEWLKDHHMLILRMQSPFNILTSDLRDSIQFMFEEKIFSNPEYQYMKALVIAGTDKNIPQKAFSVGASLHEIREMLQKLAGKDRGPIGEFLSQGHQFMRFFCSRSAPKYHTHPFAIYSLINGLGAFGGGLELALSCDRCYGIAGSSVRFPEASFGILPGWGGTIRAYNRLRYADYYDLIEKTSHTSIESALSIGLIDGVFENEEAALNHIASLTLAEMEKISAETYLCQKAEIEREIDGFINRAEIVGVEKVISNITAFLEKKEK